MKIIAAFALFLLILIVIVVVALSSSGNHSAGRETGTTIDPSASSGFPAGGGTDPLAASSSSVTSVANTERPSAPVITRAKSDASTASLTGTVVSQYALLVSLADHRVVASKNGDARMYPASMTKVMTLIVAYEAIEDLNDTFTVTNTIIDPVYKAGASLAGFSPGETVTIRDLLYGLILPSGAEAAVSLAVYTSGSEAQFVAKMNKKAKDMGLQDTHFTNCSGLHDENHYSTCADMAYIMEYALAYPLCREILSTYQYTTSPSNKHSDGIPLESTMFQRMYGDEPDGATVIAGKTGYTGTAHQCLVSYAENDRNGNGFILVTADAPGRHDPINDAIAVYSKYH